MRRLLLLLVPILLVGGVAAAVVMLRIETVRVEGLDDLSPQQVIETSGLRPNDRILWVRLSAAERRVSELPGVERAVARRSLPSTVVIEVTERTPLARLDGDFFVDADGRAFLTDVAEPLPMLEGWTGVDEPGGQVDELSQAVLEAFETFPEALRRAAGRVVVGPPLVVVLTNGTEVRFGALTELAPKAAAAQAVLEAEAGRPLAYVDVRSPTVPVSRAADPTPTPTSGP